MEFTGSLFIAVAIVAVILAGLFIAYQSGVLDPAIEKIGVYMFKAKAAAEKKKMQAEGMKAGEDFVDSQVKGNQQAAKVADGAGLGALKKQL